MDPRINEVIKFWFDLISPEKWFDKDAAFDEVVRDRFGHLHTQAAAGELSWRSNVKGRLALLVVLDQFPRNMFRDDPRAYATDSQALSIAQELLDSGEAKTLTTGQRLVALLPFQHAENLALQEQGVAAYTALLEEVKDSDEAALVEYSLEFSKRHLDVIKQFGRFPHRNAALGRASTAAETAFLAKPDSSF